MRDGIFISYRRDDSEADAGRLHSDLVREFTPDRVFKDVDSIPLGGSVQQRISDAISSSAVVLVLIGPNWSPERLSAPDDWVRMEIASAIGHRIPIIPVLLRRAKMPDQSQLPEELASLVDYNAAEIEHSSWRRDLAPIVEEVGLQLQGDARRECTGGGSEAEGGDPLKPVPRRLLITVGAVVVIVILGVLAAVSLSGRPEESPSTTSDATVDVSATSPPSVEPPSTELIPITLDSPLVEVRPPAVLTDEGYVEFPQADAGEAKLQFTANASAEYFVWARVRISPDAVELVDSNSLYVVEGENLARSDEFVWDFWESLVFPEPGRWEWDRISRRGATGSLGDHADNPFTVAGRAGQPSFFTLGGREPGVMIERIYVTTDATWEPPGCAASLVCSSRRTGAAENAND